MSGAGDGESAPQLLLKCIDERRVDVLCSILSQLKNKPDFSENVDVLCCTAGTLLHHAVVNDSVDAINTLLSCGVNPCVQNDQGKTPFQICQSDGARTAFVQEVLRAITMSNNGRLCQLISSGVPVDSFDSPTSKNTLLNWAADYGTVEIVRTLCESGAQVDLANAKGETPLLTAVRRGDEGVVRQLLTAGAAPDKKSDKGDDAFSVATAKGGALLPLLSMDTVTREVRRTTSMESIEFDRTSIISCETSTANLFSERQFPNGRPDSWTDLLWPQPQQVKLLESAKPFPLPKDARLKIYFDDASDGCPRRMMQAIQISAPLLSSAGLDLEYRGHKTADHDVSPLDGKVTVGVYADGRPAGAYSLAVEAGGVEIQASDYAGVRYAFATLVQIVRLHKFALKEPAGAGGDTRGENGVPVNGHHNGYANGNAHSPSSSIPAYDGKELPGIRMDGNIGACAVRDQPDRAMRAIFQDFSGCRVLNTETLLQLATRLSYCKANYLFVNFEVRTTDRYQLPYTNRDLFHMMQVCDELFVTLVPSIDLQSNYIEPLAARQIIDYFLDDFPLSKTAHFGPNLASILVANKQVLASVQRRVPRIFLSVDVTEKNADSLNRVPPYVTLCVEGRFPSPAEKLLSPRVSILLRFSTGDDGYLCAAPDSTAKKALLAAKLAEGAAVCGTMVCDLSTGCEIMPTSLSYMPLLAGVGVAWNGRVDMKKYAFLLPSMTAHHVLLDGDMVALFDQAATLGMVEHQLTRFSYGLWRPGMESGDEIASSRKMPISVFVEMILNPENLTLERLTPVIFKKARIELRRSLRALDDARRLLPYNFELALVLAEIRLVTELLALASKLGQSLCMHGGVGGSAAAHEAARKRSAESGVPYSPGRVGVVHLPLAIRTDLANSLLEIRAQFQHVWLSRSIASTLPNALKIFDNLFRALLPPDLQEMGKQLL